MDANTAKAIIDQRERERESWAKGKQNALEIAAEQGMDTTEEILEWIDAEAEATVESISCADTENAASYAVELAYSAGYLAGLAQMRISA